MSNLLLVNVDGPTMNVELQEAEIQKGKLFQHFWFLLFLATYSGKTGALGDRTRVVRTFTEAAEVSFALLTKQTPSCLFPCSLPWVPLFVQSRAGGMGFGPSWGLHGSVEHSWASDPQCALPVGSCEPPGGKIWAFVLCLCQWFMLMF